MKRLKVLTMAAVAAVLVSSLTFTTDVYATSRTTTLEVAGATRTAETPQVLGEQRTGVVTDTVTVGQITNAAAQEVLKSLDSVAEVINEALASGSVVVAVDANGQAYSVSKENIAILDSMEVTAKPGVEVSEAHPLYVSFSFPGVVDSTKAFVFHFENGKWVVVPTEVKNSLIVGKFTSLSPVAVVVDKTTLDTSTGANNAKSPRTGDSIYWVIAICAVVAVGAAVLVFGDKKRA